ncbi:MAG: tryptophan 7-halogenase [Streptosporangiaceae bacterium]|nr:tryptophan 7-halogenase [Streptosporangiaceae bacterium]
MPDPVNVLVIGGGPAGSIAATLLAQGGASVQLLEREFFPRYHIGESVSPSCRSIIDLAGAHEKIDARGYIVKNGLLLRWGADRDWTVNWPDTFGGDVRAWQVDRADFDQVLLEHAASQGVAVQQGATAKAVTFAGGRAVGAEWLHAGERRSGRFDYIVDASGRSGLLSAQHFKNRQPNEVFRNVAIWGYYQGGELLPGTPAGGINVISSPEGWYWVIPLSGDRFSVGFVTHQTRFLQRKASYPSLTAMFADLVAQSGTVADLMRGARHDGRVRVEQDFSYSASRYCGPGYFIVGDAACFLDPLLSTGVHLALYSGMLAATSILATRNGDVTGLEAQGFFESLYRNAYSRLFAMVSGFYQQYRGRAGYFWLAQRLARGQLVGNGHDNSKTDGSRVDNSKRPGNGNGNGARGGARGGAFAAITAGLADLHDASRAGGTAPMAELAAAAVQAGQRASAAVPAAGSTLAPMMMDANDLYDAATGLYLVTSPTLGIRRADRVPAAEAAAASASR